MTQVAADALGLPAARVRFELGDTRLPPAPVEGGSMTVASTGSAVHDACLTARDEVSKLAAGDDGSPLRKKRPSATLTASAAALCSGERASPRASSSTWSRTAAAAPCTAGPTLATVIEPPSTGARGKSESPSSKRTFVAGRPSASAAIWVMAV